MQQVVVEHSGTKLPFTASLIARGRTISIELSNGNKHKIRVPQGIRALRGFMPSVEGEVLHCLHTDNSESFCDTMTGEWLGPADVALRTQHFLQ